MNNALLITNTNVNTSSGNMTLVLRRAEAMFHTKGIRTTIVVYKGIPQKKITECDEYYEYQYIDSKKELLQCVNALKPSIVILYGDRIEFMAAGIKRFCQKHSIPTKIYIDVQGAIEEIKEYANSWKRKYFYPIYLMLFKYAISVSDGAFVVSDELIENCEQHRIRIKKKIDYMKVRCGINRVYTYPEIEAFRKKWRKRFKIDDDTLVFVYSGYRAGWQKVPSIIEHFQRYDKAIDKAYFMFFCNNDDKFEKEIREKFPRGNFTITLLGKSEYLECLTCCDVGYILRDYNETNRVAFPNKFADYLSSGLLLAVNRALPEPVRILENHGLAFIDSECENLEENYRLLRDYRHNRREYVIRALECSQEELLYDTQVAKLDI